MLHVYHVLFLFFHLFFTILFYFVFYYFILFCFFIYSPFYEYYNHPQLIKRLIFKPSFGNKWTSKCFNGCMLNQDCKFDIMYWKRLSIICKDRIQLYEYPIVECVVHHLKHIDCYYPTKDSQKLYTNKQEWTNSVWFITCYTKTTTSILKDKRSVYKAYKATPSFIQLIWNNTYKGKPIIEIMKQLNDNYCTTLQDIMRYYWDIHQTDIVTLNDQFEGDRNNKYLTGSLLNRNTLQSIIKSIQKSYGRRKWQQFKLIYFERLCLETCFDATFGICSKLYKIKNDVWHLLKVSFGHIEDDLGLTVQAILLPNASESHEKVLDFITDFIVCNIQNCKYLPSQFVLKVGTDNCARDVNIEPKIISLLKEKLNVDEDNPLYINNLGLVFDISKFSVIVK